MLVTPRKRSGSQLRHSQRHRLNRSHSRCSRLSSSPCDGITGQRGPAPWPQPWTPQLSRSSRRRYHHQGSHFQRHPAQRQLVWCATLMSSTWASPAACCPACRYLHLRAVQRRLVAAGQSSPSSQHRRRCLPPAAAPPASSCCCPHCTTAPAGLALAQQWQGCLVAAAAAGLPSCTRRPGLPLGRQGCSRCSLPRWWELPRGCSRRRRNSSSSKRPGTTGSDSSWRTTTSSSSSSSTGSRWGGGSSGLLAGRSANQHSNGGMPAATWRGRCSKFTSRVYMAEVSRGGSSECCQCMSGLIWAQCNKTTEGGEIQKVKGPLNKCCADCGVNLQATSACASGSAALGPAQQRCCLSGG